MKKKVIIIVCVVLAVGIFVCSGVFLGSSNDSTEKLFNDVVKSLDADDGNLQGLFLNEAVEKSPTLAEDIAELNEYYQGKSTEIKNLTVFHETGNVYRAYGVVKTDKDAYFLTISATGGRKIDPVGIKQLILERNKTFKNKEIFKKKQLVKYEKKAKEFGVTIRTPKKK